ncbi:MAG: MBL fold metallo-hydrolase [Gemmatimonadetes bacterium]|nr:MBL fold metallo-hydrolase [Gemmatimonadota bacterium]MYE68792.1 MBL fold metallo-hydrolase [Gemmatimonadota bacterium]MYJ70055.1 MBL fold metallo-hydrolase [Gemmatimonadota bacterium]
MTNPTRNPGRHPPATAFHRQLLAASALLSATASSIAPLGAQQNMANVQIETIELENDLFMLIGRGGNIGLSVGDDGAFLVDDQFAPLTDKIVAAVAAVTDEPVPWVLNTHWHGDHTGGNENLGEAGAMIVAHENVYRRMNPAEFADLIGRSAQAPRAALPVVTFDNAVTFHWNGRHIRVTHIGTAHTDGDAIVHFPRANVFHMGDTFFNGRYPFIDIDSGGGVDGVIEAANFVLERSDDATRIIPGHGDLASPADLRAYRDMLETVRLRVAGMVAAGRTADEVVAAAPTADLDAVWGANSERFVRAVYTSLAGS